MTHQISTTAETSSPLLRSNIVLTQVEGNFVVLDPSLVGNAAE